MDNNRQIVYLAALLHDIGKFYQRAHDNELRTSRILDHEVKELESMYCSQYNGQYFHKHVLWTAQFIADFEPVFKRLLGEGYSRFFAAAVGHHNPDPNSLLQVLVQKADHYSSGVDRTKSEGQKDAEAEKKWDDFKRVRMCSIFEGLLRKDVSYQYRLPVAQIKLADAFFPRRPADFSSTADEEYKVLWENFTREFKLIQAEFFPAFAETILALLQKYTVTVPSSTQHLPDVSLFDHLKSTAAMALCLYDYLSGQARPEVQIAGEEQPLLMIGADLSGIQAFIYDIVGRNAAKNLKGRSFYLQLLIDTVLQRILDTLDLYQASVIYASGGGFYILAPNTGAVRDKLASLVPQIQEGLFMRHQSSLFLAVDSVPVSQDQIFGQRIDEVWRALTQKLNNQKRRRFHRKLIRQYNDFFSPSEVGGTQNRDVITNEEFSPKEPVKYLDQEGTAQPVKLSTYEQIRLGRELRSADYWATSVGGKVDYWKEEPYEPGGLEVNHYFLSKDKLSRYQKELRGSADNIRISAINRTDFLSTGFAGTGNSYGFTFYGGNQFPKDDTGEPKFFDDLTGDEGTSFQRLGILRMDVDNLGQIFIRGLDEHKRTFSRYSTLSRSLDYFFRGFLNHIWESDQRFRDYTYIVYSGGDDLFVVGKWDYLIDFAKQINAYFRQWTCHNPSLSLSGGIAIVTGKFPIAKGASMAEEAEKQAKSHVCLGREKDAFCLLGMALNWENEFPVAEALKEELVVMIQEHKMPKSLLGKINAFYEMSKAQQKAGRNESWRWMIAYDFARAIEQNKRSEPFKAFLEETQRNVFADTYKGQRLNSQYAFLELLNLAARWAELQIRSRTK